MALIRPLAQILLEATGIGLLAWAGSFAHVALAIATVGLAVSYYAWDLGRAARSSTEGEL